MKWLTHSTLLAPYRRITYARQTKFFALASLLTSFSSVASRQDKIERYQLRYIRTDYQWFISFYDLLPSILLWSCTEGNPDRILRYCIWYHKLPFVLYWFPISLAIPRDGEELTARQKKSEKALEIIRRDGGGRHRNRNFSWRKQDRR